MSDSDIDSKRDGFGIGEAGRVPESGTEDLIRAAQKPTRAKMIKCDCGHTVPQSWAMNASTGTSCPDCYDRMSDE